MRHVFKCYYNVLNINKNKKQNKKTGTITISANEFIDLITTQRITELLYY
jgi:hypothetical protein